MTKLDPDERHEVHAARVNELCAGDISGKEFVHSLVHQVGFTTQEAREQWQALKDQGQIAIYSKAACRLMVEYPVEIKAGMFEFRRGMISSLYGSDLGAVVQTSENAFSMRVPFSLFELRLAK
jgi:hypothetical protein